MVEGVNFLKYKHDIPECPCTVTTPPDKLIAYCDIKFGSIWSKPYKALEKLRQCAGIITSDFSTYQDDPEPIKLYNTYRMQAFRR